MKLKQKALYLFLLPSLLGMAVFYVGPFFVSIYYMLIDNISTRNFVHIANILDTLDNQAFVLAAGNTLAFMAADIPLVMLLSLAFTLMLRALPVNVRRVLVLFFLVPLVIPSGSMAFLWKQLLAVNGTLNRLAAEYFHAGLTSWLNSAYALPLLVLIFLWKNIGFNIILYQAGLDMIPKDYYEYATVEGAGRLRQFFAVTLVYLSPTFLLVFIMSAVNSFKVFREVYMLTGAHPSQSVYLMQHFINNQFTHLNYQRMASASFMTFMAVFVMLMVLYRLQRRQSYV